MKRQNTLIGIIMMIIVSLNLNAQVNTNDYFLLKNNRIENTVARRLVIKILSDSTYEFVDNVNRSYKIDKSANEIDFPLSEGLSTFNIKDGKIEIKAADNIYSGTAIDINTQKEKEFYRYLLVDMELPSKNDSDSLISTLDGITNMRNSETLYLSYHQKSLYPRHDENGSCLIQFEQVKTSVCDIDNQCTMSGIYNKNKDLLFKNKMRDYQLKEDFIYTLFIDKNVKIKDINTTIKAIRKIDNLSKIYFAVKAFDKMEYTINYISIPISVDLEDDFSNFLDWISANSKDRFIKGEKLNIVEDEPETKGHGFGIVD